MKLIDRITINRVVNTLLDFIYKILQLYAPKKDGSIPEKSKRKPLFPKIRKNQ